MTATFNTCQWNAVNFGAGSFVVASAVAGFQLPSALNVLDGGSYRYYATDGTLVENGTGVWSAGTNTLTRLPNDGAAAVAFVTPPVVEMFPSPLPLELPTPPIVVLPGFLFGLTLSTAGLSVSFSISAGQAANSTGSDLMVLASAYTKTRSAWAVGSGSGALDTGTIAASTWYNVFLIKRTDTGVVDVLISLGLTPTALPTGYTEFRRLGSIVTDGSSHWVKFVQLGDTFLWDVAFPSVSAFTGSTAIQTVTVATPPGYQVDALIWVLGVSGTSFDGRVSVLSPDVNSPGNLANSTLTINAGNFTQSVNGAQSLTPMTVRTNSSAQIKFALAEADGSCYIATAGWIDTRGRLY